MSKAIRGHVPTLELLIQVQDDDTKTVDGAFEYETHAPRFLSKTDWTSDLSPDDLYILYTGGTTGMPKGVLWRQEDIIIAALGGRRTNGEVLQTVNEFVETVHRSKSQIATCTSFYAWRRTLERAPSTQCWWHSGDSGRSEAIGRPGYS